MHHFSPAHCPWVNGTVEVLMRSVLKTLKMVLADILIVNQWRTLVPLVQHALRHTPCSKLCNGRAPIMVMTMLPPGHPFLAYRVADVIYEVPEDTLARLRDDAFQDLASARDQLHRAASDVSSARRKKERGRINAKTKNRQCFFTLDNYVLIGKVSVAFANKLQAQWLGPRCITEIVSDLVFVVEDLRDGTISTHHASRFKFFATKDLIVTQDLKDRIAYVEGGHLFEDMLGCRYDRATKQWQVQVKWFGLDLAEASWEPAFDIATDIPKAMATYLRANSLTDANVAKLRDTLAASHPDVVKTMGG